MIFWIENDKKYTVNEPTMVLVLHNLLNCLYLHLLLNFTSPKRARCCNNLSAKKKRMRRLEWPFCERYVVLFSSAGSRMLRTICPCSWTHLARAKFGCNWKISSTWSICCFVTELSSPTTSLLGLKWMGLVESHKDVLKGYRSRNIPRVTMAKFRSTLHS